MAATHVPIDEAIEIWLRMYEGQIIHARHHEALRGQSTNIIVAVSAAILAFAPNGEGSSAAIFGGVFVVVVNFYGWLMSLKHYERSRLHIEVANGYRDVIGTLLDDGVNSLSAIRSAAHQRHDLARRPMSRIPANRLWAGLHIVLAICGASVALMAVCEVI